MSKFQMKWPILVGMALAVMLGATSRASAAIEIDWSIDNGPVHQGAVSGTNTVIFSSHVAEGGVGYTVALSFNKANSPGTAMLAFVTGSHAGIQTDSGNGGLAHTLHLYVSANNFTSPTSPPPTMMSVSSSADVFSSDNGIDITYGAIGSANNLLRSQVGFAAAASVSGLYSTPGGQFGAGNGPALSTLYSPGSPYALTDQLDIKITGQANITNVTSNLQVTPTPVPSGIVMALTGLPVLGIGLWIGRRQLSPVPAVC